MFKYSLIEIANLLGIISETIVVKSCLEFSLKFISNGTILYIDDYYNSYKGDPGKGLNKLIKTMLKKYKVKYEKWHIVGSFGQSFILYK